MLRTTLWLLPFLALTVITFMLFTFNKTRNWRTFRHLNPEDLEELPVDQIRIVGSSRSSRNYKCCNRTGPIHFVIKVYGELIRYKNGRVCPHCEVEHLKNHAIQCGRCGLAILPGDDVTQRYIHHKEDASPAAILVHEQWVLCCMRPNCCLGYNKTVVTGQWTLQGYKSSEKSEEPETVLQA